MGWLMRGRLFVSVVGRPEALGFALCLFMMTLAGHTAAGRGSAEKDDRTPIPIDNLMHYSVSYAGVHCGSLTLESFVENTDEGPIHRIVMTARTSKFFDGIYKVRSKIESLYSASRMSSTRYHEHSVEKQKVKDKLYVVEFDESRVRREEGDEEEFIPITSEQVYDPLSFLYRVRRLVVEPGDEIILNMVTDHGDVATVAEAVKTKTISTPFGRREALLVVPRPADEEMFSKKGTMNVWLSTDDRRIPYRIEFELSFGRLVAKLKKINGQEEKKK